MSSLNDPNIFGYEERPQAPAPQPPRGSSSPAQHRFSSDELRVLSECNEESFYRRSLPLGTLLGFGTFAGVMQGRLKAHPKFGAFPKVTLAVVVGYFLGKISYQQACAEKLMALPGSYIGQLLRDKRDGKMSLTPARQQNPPTMFGAGPNDIYSDAGPGSSLNLDTDRPIFSDDTYQSSNDDTSSPVADAAPARPSLSYDDLRRKNRGEYSETKQDPYRMEPSLVPSVSRARPSLPPTNQYGDVVE